MRKATRQKRAFEAAQGAGSAAVRASQLEQVGAFMEAARHWDEAVEQISEAMRLDPKDPRYSQLGAALESDRETMFRRNGIPYDRR